MSFTVIAWSWGDALYHEAARSLRARCEELGYPHDIEIDVDLSEHIAGQFGAPWRERQWIYRYIPTFIRRKREELTGPLLYLHADMTIREPIPEASVPRADVALESGWSQRPPRPDDRVLAAPIYVADTAHARRFIGLWCAYCRYLDDGMGEHNQLIRVWSVMSEKDRSLDLKLFDPPLGSIRRSSDVPIVGTK